MQSLGEWPVADETRLPDLQRALRQNGAGLLVLAPSDNLRYALRGYAPTADERFCALLIAPGGAAFVVPAVNAEQARAHAPVPLHTYTDAAGPGAALSAALDALGAARPAEVLVDEEMRAEALLFIQQALPAARYRGAGAVVTPRRSRKDAAELALLRAAAATADAGVEAVYAACQAGITERELVDIAAAAMLAAGADSVAFADVAAGPHAARPHHHPGSYALQLGDALVIDIGSRLDHYCSDITRVAVVGRPTDAEYERVSMVVEAAWQAAFDAARPGVPAQEVDDAARRTIASAGYGDYFVHRTGHGLGLSVHEPPYITGSSRTVLEEGMVFSIEPGIYLPGRFGIRLEEIVYLDHERAHVLSRLPRTVRLC